MSTPAAKLPHARKCGRCQAESGRSCSARQGPCLRCRAGLGGERGPEDGARDLQAYGNARPAMEVESTTYTDFISCDRAGRRNAVHDIQGDATAISMRKLTGDISDLSIEGAESQVDATSSEKDPGARPKGEDNSPSP